MSDIGAVVANLKELQAKRNGRLDDVGSSLSSVKSMLDNANELLAGARVQGTEARPEGQVDSREVYESIRRNLDDVRQFASELRNGRY